MPTSHREKGFSFRVYFVDHGKPHVHVVGSEGFVKMRIEDCFPVETDGLKASEMRQIRRIVREKRGYFAAEWNKYFAGEKTK